MIWQSCTFQMSSKVCLSRTNSRNKPYSTHIHLPPVSTLKNATWNVMACFLGFGCSPARIGGMQLNDVDLSIFVGPRQNTSLWWLWLNIAAKVVERQELGVNLAGVRKHWVWERKDICYFSYFGKVILTSQGSNTAFLLSFQCREVTAFQVKNKKQFPCSWYSHRFSLIWCRQYSSGWLRINQESIKLPESKKLGLHWRTR